MARDYEKINYSSELSIKRRNMTFISVGAIVGCALAVGMFGSSLSPWSIFTLAGLIPSIPIVITATLYSHYFWVERERAKESERRGGAPVLGQPPLRDAFENAIKDARKRNQTMIDKYLVGFELDSGDPIWVSDDEICQHGAVFAKTGVGKTLWLESIMFQQMARGRASGLTFIDAKRDPGTLADIIMMALITGRIEDVIVIDPFDPVCSYNFVFTDQRPDVKARKVLRCGLPPTSDQSTTKHYDRLAADAVYRVEYILKCLVSF